MKVTLDEGSVFPRGSESARTSLGLGCFVLFLLPFAAVGAVTAVMAVQRGLQGNWREMFFFALFGLTFGGVGFGGIALTLVGKRKLKEQGALKARHPDEPWKWQKDWATGRIDDASQGMMWLSWVFAGLWNLVSIPAGYAGVKEALYKDKPAAFLALLFPLVGAGILIWAIRSTLRYKKYGISRLELSTIPGAIGRLLAGTVRATTVLQPVDGFLATLSCIHAVTTRSGKNSSTTESILWQDEQRVRGEPSRDSAGMGTRIPVAFRLPSDVRPCDASDPDDRILWRLTVSASVPGVDYHSVFEVPVFRTPASEQPLSNDEERLTRDQFPAADFRQPPDSRITVTKNRRGTEIIFPAARNPGAATGGTVFTLVWLAILWCLIYFKAPILFPIVFGLFALILVYGTLQMWLGVSRVTVAAGTLALASGYLSPGAERTLAANEITDVGTRIGMQAGSTPYYDVVVFRKDGKKMTAGRSVRNKREAEWLAEVIKDGLGLESKKLGAGSWELGGS